MRSAALCACLAAAAAVLPPFNPARAADPTPELTRGDLQKAFTEALVGVCLGTRIGGITIAGLPESSRLGLHPASAEARRINAVKGPDTPVWSADATSTHLTVIETSAGACEVHADQLRVEETFQHVIQIVKTVRPAFMEVPVKPGYFPIVRQLELVENGSRYTIRLEGAEPGAPGHAYRFSLVLGSVVRQPADAKSPFPK